MSAVVLIANRILIFGSQTHNILIKSSKRLESEYIRVNDLQSEGEWALFTDGLIFNVH